MNEAVADAVAKATPCHVQSASVTMENMAAKQNPHSVLAIAGRDKELVAGKMCVSLIPRTVRAAKNNGVNPGYLMLAPDCE